MQESRLARPRAYKCSIVIPAFNKWFYTSLCMMGLDQTLAGRSDFEVIIVDNASTDETADRLRGVAPPYRVMTNSRNGGFARACNQGAAAATGEYLLFLNNDTVPTEGWLDAMLQVADGCQDVGIVGSKLLYPDGTIQHAGVAMTNELVPVHMYCLFPADYAEVTVNRDYQAVTGACLLIRRALFEELGGFDERYLNSYEDIDLCCRVRRRGLKVVYAANSVLYHFESVSSGRFERDDANQRLFLCRWSGYLVPDQSTRYLAAGFTDVPRVPGMTVPELRAQLSDRQRLGRQTREYLSLLAKEALPERARLELSTPETGSRVGPGSAWATLPEILEAGKSTDATLVIVNLTDSAWRASEGWFATYQWLTERGTPLMPEARLPLDVDVWRGQIVSLKVALMAPGEPGTHQIRWGLGRQREPRPRDFESQLATQGALVGRPYGAEYEVTVPTVMAPGEQGKIVVSVRNTGAKAWPAIAAFALGYHWYDASGCAAVQWDGPRAVVGERVAHGESVALAISVTAPDLAGEYVLAFDMLEEGKTWFSWAGVPEYRSQVRVGPGPGKAPQADAANGAKSPDLKQPLLSLGSSLSAEVVALLRAKDRRIDELLALAESLQPLRALLQQRDREISQLRQNLAAAMQRVTELEAEVGGLRGGKVLRALLALQLWRRRWRL
ncbi:MAG: glycosyltransferase [Chloroflexi bacterium]|nr:glycosyltransferase [Chloroflexota bacterium]MCL5109047.1 glycosyltransferase [Chloroflexota bacterium]